jgi:kynurenine formamidase
MIDLSHPLDPDTPVYPDYPRVAVTILDGTDRPSAKGNARHLNSSHVSIGLHCGTHMDAPFHFFGEGQTIDRIPLERCVGPTALVRIDPDVHGGQIEPVHLSAAESTIRRTGRIVLDTGWHQRWGQGDYFDSHPVLSGAAARYLVELGVGLVGIDTPSVDRPPFEAHLALLGRGVLIVENLTNLGAIAADVFTLAAIPLALRGRDGSPVRAVAMER